MKHIIVIFILLFLFSCKKEDPVSISDTELWIKVSSSIESLDVSFTGENAKGIKQPYVINYNKGVFASELKTATDKRDGQTWTLVYVSNEKSNEIEVTCNNKKYRARGFSCNEKRLIEISFNGIFTIKDHDISIIEKIIMVD